MVICLPEYGASIINENFETKNCSIIDCTENWKEKQKLINDEDGNCVPDCGNMFKYLNRCYRQCPEGTYNTGVNNVCEEIKEINNNTNEASIEKEKNETWEIIELEISSDIQIKESYENEGNKQSESINIYFETSNVYERKTIIYESNNQIWKSQ